MTLTEKLKKELKEKANEIARLNKEIESIEEEIEAFDEERKGWQAEFDWPKQITDAGMGGAIVELLTEAKESAKRYGPNEVKAIEELLEMFYP